MHAGSGQVGEGARAQMFGGGWLQTQPARAGSDEGGGGTGSGLAIGPKIVEAAAGRIDTGNVPAGGVGIHRELTAGEG